MDRIIENYSQLSRGLNKDFDPIKTDKEFLTFALNAINDSHTGSRGSIHSEPGNELCTDSPRVLNGVIEGNDEVFLFSSADGISEIGVLRDCKYETIVEADCLNFQDCNQIQGEFRIKNGCDRVLYWNDCNNPDRRLNVDRLQDYKDADGNWNCNAFRLNPEVKHPCVELVEVKEYGGALEYGTYFVVVEFLDDNENVIYRTNPSQPINITGGLNVEFYDPTLGGLPPSHKSICLRVTDVDPIVDRLRFNVVRYISGDGITRTGVRFKTTVANTDSGTVDYVISRVTPEDELVSVDELIIPNVVYDTSCAMEQVQGRLLRANLKEKDYDFNSFQKYASKIGANFVVQPVLKGAINNLDDWWDNRSFQGNEVYSPFIKYVMDDGTLSPMFHIPGTPMNYDPVTGEFINGSGQVGETITKNCISFSYSVVALPGAQGDVITIGYSYKLDGDLRAGELSRPLTGTFTPYEEVTDTINLFCHEGTITDVQIQADLTIGLNFQSFEYTFGVEVTEVEDDQHPLQIYGSHDCTKSPVWLEEMQHIISEEAYRAILGDLYGKFDEESVKAIQELDVPCRWEWNNSAILSQPGKGRFGYYECQQGIYENDCEEDYWGVDITGEPLAGKPIRHFRVPSRKLIPLEGQLLVIGSDIVNKIGFEFSNIEYPPGAVGHYFVFAKRTDFNRQVIDTGIVGNMNQFEDKSAFAQWHVDNPSQNWSYYLTPKMLYNGEYLNATHTYTNYAKELTYDGEAWANTEVGAGNAQEDYAIVAKRSIYDSISSYATGNRILEENYRLDTGEYIESDGERIVNPSLANPVGAAKYIPLIDTENVHYTNFEVYNPNINCNLDISTGFIAHPCMMTLETNAPVFGGDVYISEMKLSNWMFLGVNGGFWSNFLSAIFNIATLGVYSLFEDGNLEDYQDLLDIARGAFFQGNDKLFFDDDGGPQSWYGIDVISGVWVESEINNRFRLKGIDPCNTFYDPVDTVGGDGIPSEFQSMVDYLEGKIADKTFENPKGILKTSFCPETYYYNFDHSLLSYDKPCVAHTQDCSLCRSEFPNRIVYSQVSFDEELQDTYSITLANDYIDIPSNKGDINSIFFDKNKLYIHTENSTFVKQTNPQILQTNENNIFVGTGEFLALPEIEFNTVASGYAGLQSRFGSISTEFGYVWVDEKRGQIFVDKGNGVTNLDISVGMGQWLKENLPSKLRRYADCYDYKVCDQIGVKLGYDPRYKRLLITKKDYLPPENDVFESGTLLTPEILDAAKNFVEDSWTLSFSLTGNYYTSWHSYIPDFYVNDATHYFSTQGNEIWRHLHKGNYQNYYGKKYDFITEFSVPNVLTTDLHAVHYIGKPLRWDESNNKWVEEVEQTFDRILIYNDCESTGVKDLKFLNQHENPFGNINTNNREASVVYSNDTYKVAYLNDIAVSSPVSTSNLLSVDFDNYRRLFGYIDCIPINIDYDKSDFDTKLLNDKWFKIRLFSNSDQDIKQTLHYINSDNFISLR